MNGGIELESELGQGTKTTFWIPFHKAHVKAGDVALIDSRPIPISPAKIRPERTGSGGLSGKQRLDRNAVRTDMKESLVRTQLHANSMVKSSLDIPTQISAPATQFTGDDASPLAVDRKDIHVLIVEDK